MVIIPIHQYRHCSLEAALKSLRQSGRRGERTASDSARGTMTEWNGKPVRAGWHWLERRKDGALRTMAT